MPITRKLVAQDDNDENQWLKVDHSSRFIVNDMDDWQFLFGPNSELTNSAQVVRLGMEFDKDNLDSVYCTAYLYNPTTGNVDNAATCQFRIYRVSNPNWTDVLIHTVSGTHLPNQHFYTDIPLASLTGVSMEGGDTLLVEAVMVRSGTTYRDRRYVNHLGQWDSILRLRNDIELLDITKQDE